MYQVAYLMTSFRSWVLSWVPQDQDKHKHLVRAMAIRAVAEELPQESVERQAAMDEAMKQQIIASESCRRAASPPPLCS